VRLTGDRELLVTRKFARKEEGGFTSSVTVESADGAQFKSPQKLLDELLGELAFDPLEFTRLKPRDQFDSLRSFVPGVDFESVDALNLADYNRRTEVNRQAKEAEAAANMIIVPAGTPDEPVNIAELGTELDAANVLNADVERRTENRKRAAEDVGTWRKRAEETIAKIAPELEEINQRLNAALAGIDAQIAALTRQREALLNQSDPDFQAAEKKLREEAAGYTKQADDLQKKIDEAEALPAVIDTAPIKAKLASAQATNNDVERKRQKATHAATAKKYSDESKQLTENMEARTAAKEKAIAAAQLPVPGLGFGAGVVLLNGVPFSQASSAEQLRTSCAIAMAKNPKLRVCFIRDGSLLDEDGLKLIGEMAEAHDFQVFLEKVDSSGKIGFVIENGQVAQAERSAA
jgi:bacterioferritin (cytochrome b1)